ncbi:hypothetical protein E3Q23_00122, partial [Wallemia mellicola]
TDIHPFSCLLDIFLIFGYTRLIECDQEAPWSTQRRDAKTSARFQGKLNKILLKQKTKLGKGKQAASNSTNTSFKARSVALPGQSILKDIDENEPRTKRNLTLKDLIIHMKHYSANVRKDGLLGLRELITNYPSTIQPNLSTIIDGITRIIVDEDAGVRKTLQSFVSELFPRIPAQSWTPFSPILLLFTASGLSHIFPEVRLDSIKFLDILIDFIPDFVVQGWAGRSLSNNVTSIGGRQIIECYMALLNAKGDDKGPAGGSTVTTTANAMFTLSINSRLVVLKSLSKFLKTALVSNDNNERLPLWPFASAFPSQTSLNAFNERIYRSGQRDVETQTIQWKESNGGREAAWEEYLNGYSTDIMEISDGTTLEELNNAIMSLSSAETESSATQSEADVLSLSRSMFSVIISVFLESAPSVFTMSGTSTDSVHLESVVSVVEITRELYGYLLRNSINKVDSGKELNNILTHMSKYFPFGGDFVQKQTLEIEQQMLKLNTLYCELVSCWILSKFSNSKDNSKAKTDSINWEKGMKTQVDRVCSWLSSMLNGTMTTSAQPLGVTISVDTYKSLIPSFWALLNLPPTESASEVILDALITHCAQTGIKSDTKTLSVDFISRVYLTQFEITYQGLFKLLNNSKQDQIFTKWFNNLPKLLWEANNYNLALTEVILDTIQAVVIMDVSGESKKTISPGLKLFFEAKHPSKGSIPGPWTRINDEYIHKRGIELAYLTGISSIPTEEQYWISLSQSHST